MEIPEPLAKLNPTGDALKRVFDEFAQKRWGRIRDDLKAYLRQHAAEIVGSVHFRRARKAAGAAGRPLADLCRARDKQLEYALYIAAFSVLSEDQSIQSRDEFDEQAREIRHAIWTLGETVQRPPTPEEVQARLDAWIRDSAAPQREKMLLIEQLIMWADWPAYATILWEEMDRQMQVGGLGEGTAP